MARSSGGGGRFLNIKGVLIFSTSFSQIFVILRKTERDIIINVHWTSCNVLVIFSDFNPLNAELNLICHLLALFGAHHIFRVSRIRVNQNRIFSTDFGTDFKYQISLKFVQWEPSCLMVTKGQT
jgi:hypothetical protein